MKKRILLHQKGVFVLLLALFLGMGTAYAYDFSESYSGKTFYFNITDATNHYVEITFPGTSHTNPWSGYTMPTGSLILPSTISHDGTNYTVTGIGEYAFFRCDGLTGSLTIPNSVTSIGEFAFQICSGLTGSLNLGNSVTEIGPYAFMDCGFTGSLTLPNTLTSIGEIAFGYCDGFTGSLNIPNSVTSIGEAAFVECTGFNGTLTIGTDLTSMGASAFKNCSSFTHVNYNAINCADVTETYKPFENCGGTLTIGNQVLRIPSYMFYQCSLFTGSLTIPNSVISIGVCAFDTCEGFTGTLTLGSSLTSIEWSAFYYCSGFTGSLVIPNSVTTIDDYAFTHCDGLTGGLKLGSSLNYIGDMAFAYCHFTGTLTIPNSVTVIGQAAFYGCTGLTGQLIIPGSVVQINNSAFYDCSGFTGSLTIPNSVTLIGNSVFHNCTGFTGMLTIGYGVTSMGDYAFSGCSNLSSMMVYPEIPPTLGTNAFQNVPKTIPVKVTCGKVSAYQSASGWNEFTNIQEFCDPLTYSINPDGVSVTVTGHVDGTNATGELFIPETKVIDGVAYTVTAIGSDAFSNCYGLTGSPIIPNTVTAIGNFAFSECTGLTGSLILPNTLTYIGAYAFQACPGFTGDLTLSNTLTTLGNGAFYLCDGFNGNLTLPNSITVIGKDTFATCKFTGSLTIPNSVTSIGEYAFHLCTGFTGSLTIPNSVTSIGYLAFYGCSGFDGTLTIGTSVASMGQSAFKECGFTHINYKAANCAGYNQYEGVQPFQGMNATLSIGSAVQTIPQLMFSKCTGLTGTLTIPTSVTTIEYGAFYECSGFTGSLNIPNSVTSIGGNAFYSCTGFDGTLTLPIFLTTIENSAFRNCSGFTGSLTIPDRVTSIGANAFLGCEGFTGYLHIGNSVSSIGAYAFDYCTGFTGSLTIPESVTEIGAAAFQSCMGFTGNLNIYGSLTSIEHHTFNYCWNLTGTLTLPNTVTEIGELAFNYCNQLTAITALPETPPTLGANAFQHVPTGIPVYMPCGSLSAYQSASGWNAFTNMQCSPWTVTLSVNPWDGGTVEFTDSNGTNGHYANNTTCSVLATPNDNYLFMHWRSNGEVVSCNASYSFNVNGDTALEAIFMPLDNASTIIGEGETTSIYLPSHSYYKYALTQQIYTASELGGSFTINSISFFNAGDTETRRYDVYLVHTNKSTFSSGTDWIPAYQADCVYSGLVTMRKGMWNTIVLDTPFDYNGTSNLALIMDDNSGTWTPTPHMACRVYPTQGYQAICVYGDNTNYIANSPSSYTGQLSPQKNQIMFNRPVYTITATPNNASMGTVTGAGQYGYGELCRLKATANSDHTFLDWMDIIGVAASDKAEYEFIVTEDRTLRANFFEGTNVCNLTLTLGNYGCYWGGDYLEVHFGNGMSHLFGVLNGESISSYTLPFVNGSHVELNMQIGTFSDQYHFEVRYANGNLACTSDAVIGESSYEFDLDCDEMPANWAYLGDGDNISDVFLPSYSYYNYGLSQQIYTADEIGSAGNITSIAFYNQGENNTKTRTYDIYLMPTNKFEFFSNTDWINISEEDKVFSGDVTLTTNEWTFITFDKPFVYDGTSNLVLVMDDNSGNYTSAPHMECRVYGTSLDQAIRAYSDGTNYDPFVPTSYSGTVMDMKNQIYFGFANNIDCWPPANLTANDITASSATLNWEGYQDSYNVRYRVAPPFYEDFEDEEETFAGWTFTSMNAINDIGGTGSNPAGIYTIAKHSGSYGFRFSSFSRKTDDETYDQYLISPKLTVTGELKFWFRKTNNSEENFYVGYSTTGNDLENFTWTEDLVPSTSWQEYTLQLPSNVKYIAFHYYGNFTYYVYLDDITIGGNGIPMGNWVNLNYIAGTTTEITNLDPSTNYVWQVQGNNTSCNDAGTTRWSKKATFTTECDAIIVDADNPFFEDFEGEAFVPNCWETYSTNSRQWTRSTIEANSGSASAYSNFFGDVYLVMPALELSANASAARLSFWSYNSYPDDFAPGNNNVVLLDGDTETVLWSAETAIHDWTEATIDLSAYMGQTITLAFKYAGDNGNGWYVDDVEVSAGASISLTGGEWYFIASPIANINPAHVPYMTMGDYDLYRFEPFATDEEWRNYKSTSFSLQSGQGYLYSHSTDITFTFFSTYTATAPVEVPLDYDANDSRKCWNLVGNPFKCEAYLNKEYYVLNEEGTDINPEPVPANTPIPACTAVFVKAVATGDTVVFTKVTP